MPTIQLSSGKLDFLFQDNTKYSLDMNDFQSLVKNANGYVATFKDVVIKTPGNTSQTRTQPTQYGSISQSVKTLVGLDTKINFDWASNKIRKSESVVEPTSKANIKRLTDVKVEKPGMSALYNGYSRFSVENSTGEYFIAFANNSTSSVIYNAKTLAPIKYLEKGC